jgi:hypothetical protein
MSDDTLFPVLPYTQEGQPSAGYATGADTSRVASVIRSGFQKDVYLLVAESGPYGLVGHEANDMLGKPKMTTGQACLSVLHKSGYVSRLTEKRDGQKVYVLPKYVEGRETEPVGKHGASHCWCCGVEL